MRWRVSSRDDDPVADDDPTERGSTLIEILVATVVMSSAIIVLVTGMSTLFASSIQNRTATTAGVVARDYAEALNVAVALQPAATWCSTSYTVTPPPAPTGYTAVPTYGVCPVNNATTPQFQTVTIVATGPGGLTEQLRMVVRES